MTDNSTITSVSLGRRPAAGAPTEMAQLVVIAIADAIREPSSRHLLDVDEVRFGRGERSAIRRTIDRKRVLELKIPDRRMSADHGRLVRGPAGWLLDDPRSKNGSIVDGTVMRQAPIDDGTVIELGHTALLFSTGEVEAGAALDRVEDPAKTHAFDTFDGELAGKLAALARIATTDVSVLLHGETGTGKEVIARAVHELSGRRGAFVAVNCGALPPNLVEAELFGHGRGAFTGAVAERLGFVRSADGGTLFLDEIGELPATSQVAFLRVLQEREVVPVGVDRPVKVDVRLCTATLRDLEQMTAAGEFRRDLYARVFGFAVELPPLRERRADLGMLIRRLLARIPGGDKLQLTPQALRAMLRHDWPLNIRELEKVLTTGAALATDGAMDVVHLPDTLGKQSASEPVRPQDPDALRDRLIALLEQHGGNVVAVSKAFATRRAQIYRWVQRFKIDLESYRR